MTSILEREIFQQPENIRSFLDRETGNAMKIARELDNRFRYMIIAARGSSDNAARYAQYLFGARHRIQVALATPSLFTIYGSPPDMTGALVIGVSQSGKSPDIVSVLAEGRRQGCPTLAITNDVSSPLAQAADYVLQIDTQPELSIAATKTYTTSLAALALVSCALNGVDKDLVELRKVPAFMRQTLDGIEETMLRVERYRYIEQCAVIGRGLNYGTAFEIALKVKELSRVSADPYSSADFRHGPIATAQRDFPVVVIAPSGPVFGDMLDLIVELKRRQTELILISDAPEALESANLAMPFPGGMPEWLTPMVTVLPGQRFAYRLTVEKGLDPDKPEGLRKVTETR